jgi:hypothetical protein
MSKGYMLRNVQTDRDVAHTDVAVLEKAGVLLTGHHTEGVGTEVITLESW